MNHEPQVIDEYEVESTFGWRVRRGVDRVEVTLAWDTAEALAGCLEGLPEERYDALPEPVKDVLFHIGEAVP